MRSLKKKHFYWWRLPKPKRKRFCFANCSIALKTTFNSCYPLFPFKNVAIKVWRFIVRSITLPAASTRFRLHMISWLLTLVHHRAVDAVRREAAQRRRTVPGVDEVTDRLVPPGPGADVQALLGVVGGQVREALGLLPDEQREVIALAYFGGYTQCEVSALTGVPLGTVKSRTFAGIRRLRRLLSSLLGDGDGATGVWTGAQR